MIRKSDGNFCNYGEYVDIIIVNYNTLEYLKKCLESIESNTEFPYELLIIDNDSKDGSKAFLEKLRNKGYKVICNNKNFGCARSWNQGIKATSGKYILFLNPDTLLTPGWLKKMISCAESDPQIAVVGNKQTNEWGIIIHAGVLTEGGKLVYRGYGEKDEESKYDKVCDCADVCGACYLIKRKYIHEIGLFDERFFMYAEETDYSFRARNLGYRVVYCPVTIVHFQGGSPISNKERERLHLKSGRLFAEKWGGERSEE